MTLVRTQQVNKPDDWVGTHITFHSHGPVPGQKTNRWTVWTRQEEADFLGEIRWRGSWRKYCFYPNANCVFEEVCMRELSDFIVGRTQDYKTK